jgi:hypothetical protein
LIIFNKQKHPVMKKIVCYTLLIGMTAVVSGQSKSELKQQAKNQDKPYHYFENPQVCAGCHWEKFERTQMSQHNKAFTGDFFQKQFYELVLPSQDFAPEVKNVGDDCLACHSPGAFLAGDQQPPVAKLMDNHWQPAPGNKTLAERGVFCDFCHTIEGFRNDPPYNHDYLSSATEAVDTKFGDLEFPWSPHHETATSELYEAPEICATCHNELNPYNVWVKATYSEYQESVYPEQGVVCQMCHMQPMGGKPAKMGILRPHNTDHWFGGGFSGFVEGAARVEIRLNEEPVIVGQQNEFSVSVQALATGHKFPTGSTEERDVWLRLTLMDEKDKELLHIPVMPDTSNPLDSYFITSNAKVAYPSHSQLSEPIERDALPEGDRLYHSVFLDSEGQMTFAQWFCVEEIENRLNPLEIREEKYVFEMPSGYGEDVYLKASLYYRRMPDSLADFLNIDRRPTVLVAQDVRKLKVKK